MTAADPTAGPSPSPSPSPNPTPAADPFATPVPVANAALLGLPVFIAGAIALGLNLTNVVSQGLIGAPIAIIAMSTGLFLTTATIFALRAGESAVGSVFGIFSGFWLSYAVLVLGVLHNWFGFTTPPAGVTDPAAIGTAALNALQGSVRAFVLTWFIVVIILILVSLRLPLGFTVLFVLVGLALLFVFLAYGGFAKAGGVADSGQLKTAGYFVFAFTLVGVYLFADAFSAATGGKNFPLGPAIIK